MVMAIVRLANMSNDDIEDEDMDDPFYQEDLITGLRVTSTFKFIQELIIES